jgi:hypothetical protein
MPFSDFLTPLRLFLFAQYRGVVFCTQELPFMSGEALATTEVPACGTVSDDIIFGMVTTFHAISPCSGRPHFSPFQLFYPTSGTKINRYSIISTIKRRDKH